MRKHHRRRLAVVVSTVGLALTLLGAIAVPAAAVNANRNGGSSNTIGGNSPAVECAGLTFLYKADSLSEVGDAWTDVDNAAVPGLIALTFVAASAQEWTWESLDGPDANDLPDALVTRVVLKGGQDDDQVTYADPGASSGTITWDSTHAMSHITFCGPAPCVPAEENNQCSPCDEGFTADGEGGCPEDVESCVPVAENNQCSPCDEGFTADGEGGCPEDVESCVPVAENNQCSPCDEGFTADGEGGCPEDVESCVPVAENNQCSPCDEGFTADGEGGCDDPTPSCSVGKAQCGDAGDPEEPVIEPVVDTTPPATGGDPTTPAAPATPAGPGSPATPATPAAPAAPSTAGAVEVSAAGAGPAVVPAPEVEVHAPAFAAPEQPVAVAGVVHARALPRTGSPITTLAMVAGALILLGGLSLYASTVPAVRRVRSF